MSLARVLRSGHRIETRCVLLGDRTRRQNWAERAARLHETADLGFPFEVHATGLTATAGGPAIITMRFDATVLNGKRWGAVRIYRKAGTAPYRLVKACTSTGRPRAGEIACVDRRGLAGSSRNVANTSGAPDVVMVIRTTRTSRWTAR